ncbi:M48 family metalloprotease [Aliikangiella coralliicola]|uniref:M48 family metalloprotease n=1 Tax=Aliikangiella coralliicola TaxID=2592383 RepID=A0A545U6A8_9GAMM|nr:M48 family metalloprotease [Aliikangiella coralliicola]TQV85007.1 M48 family metalloprotease [Aliikangiella coralliicola]
MINRFFKIPLSCLFSCVLFFMLGCGLKVGSLDVGKLASAGAGVITGNKMSLEEQQAVGQQMTAIIVGSSKIHPNAKLQKYVNQVGSWVALHANPEKDKTAQVQWQFIVIDTPDFNAFSMPGGYVVISSGVLDRLSSEAELAAVLAHEVVHIEQKHQVKAIEKSSTFSNIGDLAFIAADYRQSQKGGYSQDSLKNRQIAKGLFNTTHTLYTKGLSREDELDADQKAVILMTRAGYDPYAYLAVMQLIESIDDKRKTLVLATHPKPSERIHTAFNALNYVEKNIRSTKTVENRFLSSLR